MTLPIVQPTVVVSRRRTAVLHDPERHMACLAGIVHPTSVLCRIRYGDETLRCSPDGPHDPDLTGLVDDRGVLA